MSDPEFTSILAPIFVARARALAGGVDAVVSDAGLRVEALVATGTRVRLSTFYRLQEALATHVGEVDFGVRTAQWLPRGSYRLLEFAPRTARSLGDAARAFLALIGLPGDPIEFAITAQRGTALLTQTVRGAPDALGRHANEFTLVALLRLAAELTGAVVTAREAWLAHARPADPGGLREALSAEHVRFGRRRNALALAQRDLARPVLTADAALHATLTDLADEARGVRPDPADFLARVRHALRRTMASTACDVESVARDLHMSARTLQRRLLALGTGFDAIRDDVRLLAADALLADRSLGLDAIAARLGYADARSFARAYKRWTGAPPRARGDVGNRGLERVRRANPEAPARVRSADPTGR